MSNPNDAPDVTGGPKPVDPCTFVIFGATGDLTERLLTPALYHLKRAGLLCDGFRIVGVARREESDDQFRARLGKALRELSHEDIEPADWDWLARRARYLKGDFDDAGTYERLKPLLGAGQGREGNCLFYLATPASQFSVVAGHLGQAGLAHEENGAWRRIVLEKPFGADLNSAKALNRKLLEVFAESQIYRIDHYLGKETVQNIMVFRFGNGIFEPLWNRNHIDHVQITVAETLGVEGRGGYYDTTGALRDMVPSHLFQLVTLIGMEPPTCFDADASRSEKAKVLDAVHHFTPESAKTDAIRAQYGEGAVDGKRYNAYRNEPDVARDSTTETYTALKLGIDNWRWAGVPFYIRTGKALSARRTKIVIQFKSAPLTLFRDTPGQTLVPNDLTLHIQPDEGVSLRFGAKKPGPRIAIGGVEMRFNYRDYFKAEPNNGYETLLYDCMIGDAGLFQRADTIEAGWRIVQPVLDLWGSDKTPLPLYPAGSAGPKEADALIERDGRQWRPIQGSDKGRVSLKNRADLDLEILDDAPALARRAAEWLLGSVQEAGGICAVALSGGSTPKPLYELLASAHKQSFPWRTTHWFWSDERMVPPDDPESNYRMAHDAMLKHVPALKFNIHPIPTVGLTPEEGAAEYETTLKAYYGAEEFEADRPLFDAMLLGLGDNGHTASLFPDSRALKEETLWAAGVTDAAIGPRITLTYPALAQSRHTAFLVSGAGKRDILKRFMAGDESLPASHVRAMTPIRIFADKAAAGA